MPGIIDAEIRTMSDDGSLREAKVNWVCHNRRQLEILELLYMRPGYPVVLEWGWNPYIDNGGQVRNNNFTIKEKFFDESQTFETLNEQVRKYKKLSGGNYDGFFGFVKNFSYKSNEMGGFECVTEIIAHGAILESLKGQSVSKISKASIPIIEDNQIEIQDSFLFYLRSIQNHLYNSKTARYMRDWFKNEDPST